MAGVLINMRCSHEERARWSRFAEGKGSSLSQWLRGLASAAMEGGAARQSGAEPPPVRVISEPAPNGNLLCDDCRAAAAMEGGPEVDDVQHERRKMQEPPPAGVAKETLRTPQFRRSPRCTMDKCARFGVACCDACRASNR
jgi:hypothetical protein